MSWASAFWQRNKGAIQSIVKPLVSHVPVVGGVISSRINISPTPNQSALSAQTALSAGALQPAIAAVNKDSVNIAEGKATAATVGPAHYYYWIAGAVALLILFLLFRKR